MSGKRADIADGTDVRQMILRALHEDIGRGDATSRALVPDTTCARAVIVAKSPCTVCGLTVAAAVFRAVDRRLCCRALVREGQTVEAGRAVLRVSGPARGILAAERTALNFAQRLTGIATLTRRFVVAVRPYPAWILDTRKTTPGLRRLEKYAVRCGGGVNHRMGLFDRVLIKDNHRRLWAAGRSSLADAVRSARRKYPRLMIEVEVESMAELQDVLRARPEWVLLDNMPPALMKKCVALGRGRTRFEASGGVTLATVKDIAAAGVDAVSVGALTHSAPAADLSLEIEPM